MTIPKLKYILISLVVLVILGGGITGLIWKFQPELYRLIDTYRAGEATKVDATLIKTVGQLMFLPSEEPTIATVTDKEKLAKQPFFAQAENGDKVIIYTQAKKAILYRPTQKKIVDVAPLITDATPQPQLAPTTVTSEKISLTLLNGSLKPGVTNSIDDQLIKKYPNLAIGAKKAATKTDYVQTIVVDLTGKNTQLAAQIAADLGGVVNALPESEPKPTTELVVIVGNN
jgi:hypothetical protein